MESAEWVNHPMTFPKAQGEHKPSKAKISTPPGPLGCPYRKRHPLGFNIRDTRQCCEAFATVSDVINHVRSFHDRHEDGMPYLPSPLGRSETETWSMVYKALFSDNDNPPSPYYCQVVEHLEYYQIQNSCLVTFADPLEETIDVQQLNSSPVDYIMEILQKFVNVTFHFSTQYGLDFLETSPVGKKGTACHFGKFIKTEAKREGTTDPEYFSLSAAKGGGKVKTEELLVKKEPVEAPAEALVYDWKDVVGKRDNATGPGIPGASASRGAVEVIDLTGVESSVCSEEKDTGLEDAEGPMSSQRSSSDSSCRSPSDSPGDEEAQSWGECVPEGQLREILNYTCHSVLGADLDSIVNSQLRYDTLIDLAHDFIHGLTEAAATWTCNEAAATCTCNKAAGPEGHNGDSASSSNPVSGPSNTNPRTFASSRERSGDQNDQHDDNSGGSNRQNLSRKPPASSKERPREIRLPCPLRMMFPRTFNVRTHYSCSMTYFPTIGRLKDHLREYHKRQDGVEVLCPRCFAGFKSRDELHRHSRATPVCEPAEFDPTTGLHGEAVNLLRGRDKAGQDYLQQWRDICKIVFQNDQVVPMPEYHAVMEHFEFAEVFFRCFGELSRHLHPTASPEEEQLVHNFGLQAADTLFGWYHLGLDNCCQPWSQIAATIVSGDIRCKDFEVLTVYCIRTLQRLAKISWNTRYENDGSRGNGSRRPRRREIPPDRLPTPAASQGPSSLTNHSPLICPDPEGERRKSAGG